MLLNLVNRITNLIRSEGIDLPKHTKHICSNMNYQSQLTNTLIPYDQNDDDDQNDEVQGGRVHRGQKGGMRGVSLIVIFYPLSPPLIHYNRNNMTKCTSVEPVNVIHLITMSSHGS